ncbi:hypothetical protein GTR04_4389 [Trichophyton interdigitale]|uniref:Uncharacterized protein n=1 Tax=Trichophyton interdigitale TaxID=101480 RepID=A0A9P4YGD2_9EURO|nr:hypothetical protein GY631_4232 [Trichophyton interdigitale]KAF3893919.1 hypothetical protein GY632_3987 [Trichophyton interdigitale]KAG8208245.1 hypothetical protein GTR04_4389 [Trichophyton interdigitale]
MPSPWWHGTLPVFKSVDQFEVHRCWSPTPAESSERVDPGLYDSSYQTPGLQGIVAEGGDHNTQGAIYTVCSSDFKHALSHLHQPLINGELAPSHSKREIVQPAVFIGSYISTAGSILT